MPLHKKLKMSLDSVSDLPVEISQIIFLDLPPTALLNCRRVSKSWKQIAENDYIWKSKFQDQKSWEYHNDVSETDSWYELYKERYLLESNWRNDKFTQHKLSGHSGKTYCVKFYKNWILTGSEDSTIRIWDNETYQCLNVLGDPMIEILTEELSELGIRELTKHTDIKSHLSAISSIDINDKYLVSGSWDGSCIIWTLPDFKPIDRLIIPTANSFIDHVAIYDDYIVSCGGRHIGVWKSSLYNSEQQLRIQFTFQFRLKAELSFRDLCICNDVIYSIDGPDLKYWNIETGQIYDWSILLYAENFGISDKCLFMRKSQCISILDLHSDEFINKLLDYEVPETKKKRRGVKFFNVSDKIISINDKCTIRIWVLNKSKTFIKVFKKFKNLEYKKLVLSPAFSIGVDSKRLAAFTMDGDIVVYDFTENLRKKYLKHL